MGMYAKLMSRITESSLMDEAIPVRYTFVMLLAVADPQGYVVGTDVAIARRLNMPVAEFQACIEELMKPDPDSNSKEHEGRRVILSDCERGYFLVNYTKYRDTRDEEQRREYMRDYMRKYRGSKDVAPVNNGKHCKPQLAQAESEVKADSKEEHTPNASRSGGVKEGKNSSDVPTTRQSKRVADIMHRKHTTAWSKAEIDAYRKLGTIPEEDLSALEDYYAAHWPPTRGVNIIRTDLLTLLNNFPGEIDRANMWKTKPATPVNNGTPKHRVTVIQ